MEHIRHTLVGPAGQTAEPLQVVGAMNDILREHEDFRDEVTAVAWKPPSVILRSISPAASAILRQSETAILGELNGLLKRRFGGPVVERFILRPATGQ